MSNRLRVSSLGGLAIESNGALLSGFHSRKVPALAVYLLATRQPQAREVLADLLWDEQTQAAANLRVLLTDLRQILGPYFVITRTTVALNPESECWLDATVFETQVQGVFKKYGRQLTPLAAVELEDALTLYRGEFLKAFYIRESPRFEEWVLLEQERLRRFAVTALQQLASFYLEQGEFTRGIEKAARLFEIDPLNELTQLHMMQLLARSGEPHAALHQYEKYKHLLESEWNAAPSPEITALRDEIRAGNFTAPVSASAHHYLPRALTSFVGRERELAQLDLCLRDAAMPLLTLVGAGGVGKTRLALRAAENASAYFQAGVAFVALAAVSDSALVTPTIAATLGVAEKAGETLVARLQDFLRDKEMLLLVDNFEQVVDAAPRLTELLTACPRLKILVTSRERLHVYGEHIFPVTPLLFPDLVQLAAPADELVATIARYPAVALFVQRAAAVQPDFKLTASNARTIAEICARLEGLPLALELAAARISHFPPPRLLEQLAKRLDVLSGGERDRAPRHQALRLTIDWSYALLDERAKKLFRALAVFVGGWTLDAAEYMLSQTQDAMVNGVAMLVDKSLVQQLTHALDEPRFTMFETIREYALERAAERGEIDSLKRQHALYVLEFARQAETFLQGPLQIQWLDQIERELDNVRAALQWTIENEQAEIGIALAHHLGRYWTIRDHWAEGRRWLERLLALRESNATPVTRARGFFSAGLLATWMSETVVAREYLEQALALAQAANDSLLLAQVLTSQSGVYQLQGEPANAHRVTAQALALFEQVGTTYDIAWCRVARAGIAMLQGDFDAARADFEFGLAEFQRVGDYWGSGIAYSYLALVTRFSGDTLRASEYKAQALALLTQTGDPARVGMVHFFLGSPSDEPAERDAELSFFQAQVSFHSQRRDDAELASAQMGLARVLHRRGNDREAQGLFASSMNLCVALGLDRVATECLEGFAGIAAMQNDFPRAARLFGAADALRHFVHGALAAAWRGNYGAEVSIVRAGLEERAFNEFWGEGRALTLSQAIAYALNTNGHGKKEPG